MANSKTLLCKQSVYQALWTPSILYRSILVSSGSGRASQQVAGLSPIFIAGWIIILASTQIIILNSTQCTDYYTKQCTDYTRHCMDYTRYCGQGWIICRGRCTGACALVHLCTLTVEVEVAPLSLVWARMMRERLSFVRLTTGQTITVALRAKDKVGNEKVMGRGGVIRPGASLSSITQDNIGGHPAIKSWWDISTCLMSIPRQTRPPAMQTWESMKTTANHIVKVICFCVKRLFNWRNFSSSTIELKGQIGDWKSSLMKARQVPTMVCTWQTADSAPHIQP